MLLVSCDSRSQWNAGTLSAGEAVRETEHTSGCDRKKLWRRGIHQKRKATVHKNNGCGSGVNLVFRTGVY